MIAPPAPRRPAPGGGLAVLVVVTVLAALAAPNAKALRGLVTDGRAVIAAPAQGLLWRGVTGFGAERLRLRLSGGVAETHEPIAIRTRQAPARLTVATSRTHLDEVTEAFISMAKCISRLSKGRTSIRVPLGFRAATSSSTI